MMYIYIYIYICIYIFTFISRHVKHIPNRLMALLLTSIDSPAHQPRFCAVYWANRLFAFHDVRARYVCR